MTREHQRPSSTIGVYAAVDLLATGQTLSQIAETHGISRKDLYGRLENAGLPTTPIEAEDYKGASKPRRSKTKNPSSTPIDRDTRARWDAYIADAQVEIARRDSERRALTGTARTEVALRPDLGFALRSQQREAPSEVDVSRMIEEYLSTGGTVTLCPDGYAHGAMPEGIRAAPGAVSGLSLADLV